jgi:hypothetical protein
VAAPLTSGGAVDGLARGYAGPSIHLCARLLPARWAGILDLMARRRTTTANSGPTPVALPQSTSTVATPTRRQEPPDGRELFLVDATAGVKLANEARYRTLARAFGIQRSDVNLLTAMLALTAANAVYERVHRPNAPQPSTAVADLAIGVGALREAIYSVAGPASRDTTLGGTLVALAVLIGLTRQPVGRSIRGMRASGRRLHSSFLGRYGHLIPRGSGASSSPSA